MKSFVVLDHTADLRIRVYGKNITMLFKNAAEALFNCIGDTRKAIVNQWIDVEITGSDIEEVMVNWLNELLYIFDAKELFLSRFQLLEITAQKLTAKVGGETMELDRHRIVREVKAATYHELRVEKVLSPQDHWEAEIIFDI